MALEQILDKRRSRYGEFIDNAKLSQQLKDTLRQHPGWDNLAADQREALDMIMHKTARIMCGDPDYDDSWVDIAGYAQRAAERLQSTQS